MPTDRPPYEIIDEESATTQEIYDALTVTAEATVPAAASLSEVARSLNDLTPLIARGSLLGYNSYSSRPINWPSLADRSVRMPAWRETTVQVLSSDAELEHTTQLHLTVEEVNEDIAHRNMIQRWCNGQPNEEEMAIGLSRSTHACPCRSCTQQVYEDVQGRIGPTPPGYGTGCQCARCMAWRHNIALGIRDFLYGRPRASEGPAFPPYEETSLRISPTPTRRNYDMEVFEEIAATITMDDVRRNRTPMELRQLTDDQRAALRAADQPNVFQRARASRGHPVPIDIIAADWQPNAWEA